jgi:hypothetical protein
MSLGERIVRVGAGSVVWPFIAVIIVASSCGGEANLSSTPRPASSGSVDDTPVLDSPTFPSGSIEYEGIHLVPVEAEVRQACQTGANALGFAVPCPQLIPYGSEVRPCEPIRPGDEVCPPPDQEFNLQIEYPPAPRFDSVPAEPQGLVVLEAYRDSASVERCPGTRRGVLFGNDSIRLFAVSCPGAQTIRWQANDVTYVIRVIGYTSRDAGLAKILATQAEYIGPS